MTDAELEVIAERSSRDLSGAMNGGCSDYYCDCHNEIPKLVAEIRRLRAQVQGHADRIAAQSEILSRRAEK